MCFFLTKVYLVCRLTAQDLVLYVDRVHLVAPSTQGRKRVEYDSKVLMCEGAWQVRPVLNSSAVSTARAPGPSTVLSSESSTDKTARAVYCGQDSLIDV